MSRRKPLVLVALIAVLTAASAEADAPDIYLGNTTWSGPVATRTWSGGIPPLKGEDWLVASFEPTMRWTCGPATGVYTTFGKIMVGQFDEEGADTLEQILHDAIADAGYGDVDVVLDDRQWIKATVKPNGTMRIVIRLRYWLTGPDGVAELRQQISGILTED
jgi:hypothetical protein